MNKSSFLLILISTLVACGFHLRGTRGDYYKFPFETVYVECDNVIICSNFTTAIVTESLAALVTKPENAEVMIKLMNEQTSRDIAGLNSVGRISSYLLTYQAQAEVWQKGEQVGNDINVTSRMTMQYNDATILSNTQEEANFWDQIHENATNQLIMRLIHFPYRKYSLDNVAESK